MRIKNRESPSNTRKSIEVVNYSMHMISEII